MNTLKRNCCLWAFLFGFMQIVWAQNIEIHGNVADGNSKPLIGSVVQVLSDTMKIAQATTNSKGYFKLQINSKQNQTTKKALKISCIGYDSQYIELPNKFDGDIKLGTIVLLSKAQQIGEAIVNTSRTTIDNGKIIKVPSKAEREHSSDAVSLLDQMGIADLRVDKFKGTIQNNAKAVSVYINSMPATMDEVFALHPNEVVRVEYLTHPHGEFMGEDYLVNFITRSQERGGLLMGKVVQNEEVSGNYGLTYKMYHKKSQFALSYNASYRDDEISYTKVSQFTNPIDNSAFTYQEVADKNINRSHKNSFGVFHYYRTDGFSSNLGIFLNSSKKPLVHFSSTRTQSNSQQTTLLKESNSSESLLPSFDWNVRKSWKNGDVLKYSLKGIYGKNKSYSLRENSDDNETEPYFSWINNANEDYYEISNTVNYSKAFKEKGELNFKLYNHNVWFDENYTGSYKLKTLQYDGLVNPKVGYTWNYKRKFFASLEMGLNYMVTTQTNERKVEQTFFSPGVTLSYNFKKGLIQFSYDNATIGASPSYVSNVEQMMDDIQSKRGNPALQNTRMHTLRLNSYVKIPKTLLSLTMSYDPLPNITRWSTTYENGKYVHTPINDGTHHPLFVMLASSVDITKHLQARVNLGWDYYKETGKTYPYTSSSFTAYAELRYWTGPFTLGAYCYKPSKTFGVFDVFNPISRIPFNFSVYAYYTRPRYSLSVACYNINKRRPQIVEYSTGALFSQYQRNYTSLEEKRTEFVTVKLTFNLRHGNKKFQYDDFEIMNESKTAIMK